MYMAVINNKQIIGHEKRLEQADMLINFLGKHLK